jgi:hypothetical protein
MRLLPDPGLSLHYTEPKEQLPVVDDADLRMRDARGRTRELKAGRRPIATPCSAQNLSHHSLQ